MKPAAQDTADAAYLDRATLEAWLAENAAVPPGNAYVIIRNGNSWKFGGRGREFSHMERRSI